MDVRYWAVCLAVIALSAVIASIVVRKRRYKTDLATRAVQEAARAASAAARRAGHRSYSL